MGNIARERRSFSELHVREATTNRDFFSPQINRISAGPIGSLSVLHTYIELFFFPRFFTLQRCNGLSILYILLHHSMRVNIFIIYKIFASLRRFICIDLGGERHSLMIVRNIPQTAEILINFTFYLASESEVVSPSRLQSTFEKC